MEYVSDKSNNKPLAHVRQDENGEWHEHQLDEHLRGVAAMAADFAANFGSSDWANIAGVWHGLFPSLLRQPQQPGRRRHHRPAGYAQPGRGEKSRIQLPHRCQKIPADQGRRPDRRHRALRRKPKADRDSRSQPEHGAAPAARHFAPPAQSISASMNARS